MQETEPKYSNFSLKYKYIKNRGHFSETLGITIPIGSYENSAVNEWFYGKTTWIEITCKYSWNKC